MRVKTVRFGVRTAGTTFEGEGFRRTGASEGASVRRRRASNLLDIAARLSEFRRAAANGSTDSAKVMLSRDFRPDRARRRFVVRAQAVLLGPIEAIETRMYSVSPYDGEQRTLRAIPMPCECHVNFGRDAAMRGSPGTSSQRRRSKHSESQTMRRESEGEEETKGDLRTPSSASSSCDRNIEDVESELNLEHRGSPEFTHGQRKASSKDVPSSTISENSLIQTSFLMEAPTGMVCSQTKKELILYHAAFGLVVLAAFSLVIVFYPDVLKTISPVRLLAMPSSQETISSYYGKPTTAPIQAAPQHPAAVAEHPVSHFDVCWTDSCKRNGAYINALVSRELDPCDDFFKFVCSRWRSHYDNMTSSFDDDIVYRLERDVLRLLESPLPPSVRDTDVLFPLKHVVSTCMSSVNNSDVYAVLDLLSEVELEGFPFTPPVRSSISAWKTAARVFSYTGASALFSLGVAAHPFKSNRDVTTVDIPQPLLINKEKTTAAYTRLVKASMKVLGKRFVPSAYTSEVVAFVEQLDKAAESGEFLYSDERLHRVSKLQDLPEVRTYLLEIGEEKLSADENDVLLLTPNFLESLVNLVRKSDIHVVLNFLCVHVLVRTSVFSSLNNQELAWVATSQLFGHSVHQVPRWRLCVRAAAQSLPSLFLRASSLTVRTMDDVVDSVLRSVLNQMKLQIHTISFFDDKTCALAKRILAGTHFATAGPRWLSQEDRLSSYLAQLPKHTPKDAFLIWHSHTLKAVQKAALRRRSLDVWSGSPFATDCWYDLQLKTVYIPTLLSSYAMPRVDDYGTVQLSLMGHRVTRCLLRMLIEGVSSSFNREILTRSFWSSYAKTSLHQAQVCLQEQLDVPASMSLSLLEDHTALKIVEGLYESIRVRRAAARDIRLPGAEDFSARLFNCRPTSPMGPLEKCADWMSPSKQETLSRSQREQGSPLTGKYLGVTLSTTEEYLAEYHQGLKTSSVGMSNVLRRRSLWSCERYAVTRELWKAVAASALTFGNVVICVPSEVREYLERRQRAVGRQALGSHGR
ncbi:hypothetical protein HPB47_000828, partial [Ixodes persulcatus]